MVPFRKKLVLHCNEIFLVRKISNCENSILRQYFFPFLIFWSAITFLESSQVLTVHLYFQMLVQYCSICRKFWSPVLLPGQQLIGLNAHRYILDLQRAYTPHNKIEILQVYLLFFLFPYLKKKTPNTKKFSRRKRRDIKIIVSKKNSKTI